MPDGIFLTGFDKFAEKLRNLPTQVRKEVDFEVYDAANEWALRAKQAAPVDHGILKGGITSKHIGLMEADVYSNASYSAYVEWGTGTRVSVPSELASYAIQFKGQKSVVGMRPQPFFFIQMPAISQLLEQRITNNILKVEH